MNKPLHHVGARLKMRRLKIPLDATHIGVVARAPGRIGHRVTQEELSEALGISREWYSLLENGMVTRPSLELLNKIADVYGLDATERSELVSFAVPGLVLAAARLERSTQDGLLEHLTRLRQFIRRVGACASLVEAAELATRTIQEIADATCVSASVLRQNDASLRGFAAGPKAGFWTPLHDRVSFRFFERLKTGARGVSEYLPSTDEVEADWTIQIPLKCVNENITYDYEVRGRVWRQLNGKIGGRSIAGVPVYENGSFRGYLGTSWVEPRRIEEWEIDVLDTLVAALELAAAPVTRARRYRLAARIRPNSRSA